MKKRKTLKYSAFFARNFCPDKQCSEWLEEAISHGQAALWAEGAYLEPDQYYGHGYLRAIRDVSERYKLT